MSDRITDSNGDELERGLDTEELERALADVDVIDPTDIDDDPEDEFYPCEESTDVAGVARFGTTSRHVLALWLPAAFRKWGVRFTPVAGWETRGRPMSSGYFDPNGLLVHHTGTTSSVEKPAPSLSTLINGRSDLSGPLCQIATDYNGLTYLIAAGRANHAGSAKAAMGNPGGDGNAMYIGNEVMTSGLQKMPAAQFNALVLAGAAIMDHFGYIDATKTGLHHTTSLSGKWDLGAGTGAVAPYSITTLRAAVAARLAAGPPGTAPAPTKIAYPGHQHGDASKDDLHVRWIQHNLKLRGWYKGTIDGSFGPMTGDAVGAFQRAKGLRVDEWVGQNTWNALNITTANRV